MPPATSTAPRGALRLAQAAQASVANSAPPAVPAAPPPVAQPATNADGSIPGIDGVLSQVASALVRQAAPIIMPALQNDRAMQATVGNAAGTAIARAWTPWVILGAVSLGVLAVAGVVVAVRAWGRGGRRSGAYANPTRRGRRHGRRPRG